MAPVQRSGRRAHARHVRQRLPPERRVTGTYLRSRDLGGTRRGRRGRGAAGRARGAEPGRAAGTDRRCRMSADSTVLQGVEGAGGPSQAGLEDTSVSDVSDRPTACHSGVQVEQQTDSQVNTGRADAEAVRQSHGGAKRRRGRAKLDTDFGEATLAALRTRAKRLGLAPSTWVRAVVRDALHASRSEELDAAVAAHLLGVEARAQVSADARELAAQIRPLA